MIMGINSQTPNSIQSLPQYLITLNLILLVVRRVFIRVLLFIREGLNEKVVFVVIVKSLCWLMAIKSN